MCKRNVDWLLLAYKGAWPATPYALTRNLTGNLSVRGTIPNPLDHTSQGRPYTSWLNADYIFWEKGLWLPLCFLGLGTCLECRGLSVNLRSEWMPIDLLRFNSLCVWFPLLSPKVIFNLVSHLPFFSIEHTLQQPSIQFFQTNESDNLLCLKFPSVLVGLGCI